MHFFVAYGYRIRSCIPYVWVLCVIDFYVNQAVDQYYEKHDGGENTDTF